MGDHLKYLEMLQAVIARMASNQVTLRTWSVTLGTAVIGFAATDKARTQAAMLAILPATVFWVLDAYYVALEREFRALFRAAVKAAAAAPTGIPGFSFNVSIGRADMSEALRRPAVILVHLPIVILAVVVGRSIWPR